MNTTNSDSHDVNSSCRGRARVKPRRQESQGTTAFCGQDARWASTRRRARERRVSQAVESAMTTYGEMAGRQSRALSHRVASVLAVHVLHEAGVMARLLLVSRRLSARARHGSRAGHARRQRSPPSKPTRPRVWRRTSRIGPRTCLSSVRQTLVEQPSGFYPYFDSVYSGGGFTLGAGYRQFTGDRTHWNVAGLYSVKGYKLIEAGATSPGHLSGRLDLRGTASWRDATQVAYHGLGIDSPADADTAFRMQQAYAGGDVTARPHRWLLLTAAASYEDYTLKDPTGDLHPGRRRIHARDRARRRRRIPRTCTRRPPRRSTGGRPPTMRGAAGCTGSPAITTPTGTAPTASTGSTPRSCSTFRSCARTG